MRVKFSVMVVVIALCGGIAFAGGPARGSVPTGGEESFTIGISTPTAQEPFLKAIQDGAVATIEKAGSEAIVTDAQLDFNKWRSDIDELVNREVDALIVLFPFDQSFESALERAKDAGIPVIVPGWVPDLYSGKAPPAPVDGQVIDDRRRGAEAKAKYINELTDGDARILYIKLPFPVQSIDHSVTEFEKAIAKYDGLELVDVLDNPTVDPEGARAAVEQALTRYDDANVVVPYADPSGVGAAAAIESAGKTGEVHVVADELTPEGAPAIEDGRISAAWDFRPVALGVESAKMALAAAAGKPAKQWKKTVVVKGKFFTEDNIDSWVTWDDELAKVEKKGKQK